MTITLDLPDRILSSIKRLAAARGIPPEAWIREWIVVGISSEVLPAQQEDPPPPGPLTPGLQESNSVAEVAAYLRVSPRHLYNILASGGLGHVKVGTLVRIKREHVETFLKENTREARKEKES